MFTECANKTRADRRKGTYMGNLTRESRGRNLYDVFKRDQWLREDLC